MNKITGEKAVIIQGRTYVLRFTWRAVAEVSHKFGDNPNLFDPETIAAVAAIGFKEKHPELTAEAIMDMSPPLVPFAKEVQTALQWAYFGPENPEATAEKKSHPITGFWKRIRSLFKRG